MTVQKPCPNPKKRKKRKKRKIEETLFGADNLDNDFVGEAEEQVAETPLAMPEPAEPPIPRFTRTPLPTSEETAAPVPHLARGKHVA